MGITDAWPMLLPVPPDPTGSGWLLNGFSITPIFAGDVLLAIILACLSLGPRGLAAEGGRLNWQSGPEGRSSELAAAKTGKTGFTLLGSATTAITFSNLLADEPSFTHRNLLSRSRLAARDIARDGPLGP